MCHLRGGVSDDNLARAILNGEQYLVVSLLEAGKVIRSEWGLSDDNGVLLLSINLPAHTDPSQPLTTICTSPHCAKYLGPLLKLEEGKTINVTHLFPPHLIWAALHACLRRRRLLLCFHKKWATSLTAKISWWKAERSPHSSNSLDSSGFWWGAHPCS